MTLLVTAFYAYPTLAKAGLSFFACLHIDDPSKQPHLDYSIRNHTAGYFVGAIDHECFVGWHRSWALGLGLPALLVLCVGVPVGMFAFMWCNKARTADASFQEHYGFLCRNYTHSKPGWESVWAVQTVLLAAISVFHFTIQAYYALLLMGFVLLLSAAAQVAAQPYTQLHLHRLNLASTCCLFPIVWLSLALFSDSVAASSATLRSLHITAAAVVVAIACVFIIVCLVVLLCGLPALGWVVASPVLQLWCMTALREAW